jgi:hypothetical protein
MTQMMRRNKGRLEELVNAEDESIDAERLTGTEFLDRVWGR